MVIQIDFLPLFGLLKYNDGDMTPEIQTFLMAMTPVIELRGSLPFALLVHGMDPLLAYFISVLGNIVPIFIILAFLEPVSLWLSSKLPFMKKFFDFLFKKTRKDYDGRIKKYGFLALFIFTAIPLPITGAWTASLAAFLFGLPYLKSVLAIIFGVMVAGIMVYLIVTAGVALESYHGIQIALGITLLALLTYFIYHRKKTNKNV
jgi:uncharacterized membrane protein